MVIDVNSTAELVRRARPVADRLALWGHRSYVVGGLVRDLHLGRASSPDVDITTDALPEVIKDAIGDIADDLWLQGERFGTIGLRIGADEFEVTTHRSDQYESRSRKPSVEFSTAIEADLSRRDFTVNAMAIEVPNGRVIDPFHGAADLDAGVLRTPGPPERSFDDDPLRMLRAARFHAGYDLAPTPALEQAMCDLADRISIVSQERIRDETTKLLAVPSPGTGIRLLGRTGLLERIVPGYGSEVTADVAELVDLVRQDELVRQAAFYLILAEHRGTSGLGGHLRSRRHSTRDTRRTVRVLDAVFRAVERASFGDDDISTRAFLADAADVVSEAVELMSLERMAGPVAVTRFGERRANLGRTESLEDLGPAMTGDEVMEALGVAGGRDVGAALQYLRSIRLSDGELDKHLVRSKLLAWWAARAPEGHD